MLKKETSNFHTFLEQIFDISSNGIFVIDLNDNIVKMNESALNIFGYDQNSINDIIAKELFPTSKEKHSIFKELTKNDVTDNYEFTLRRKNGDIFKSTLVSCYWKKKDEIIGLYCFLNTINTENKHEQKLIKGEEKYKSIFDNSVFGIYRTTLDGKILAANNALINLLGFSSFQELTQRNFNHVGFHGKNDRQRFKQLIHEKNSVMDFKSQWKKKNGSLIYVKENCIAIRDKNGNILYLDGTVEDITKQVQAEEKARISNEYFQNLFDVALEGIVLVNSKGSIIQCNKEFQNMFGYTQKELINKPLDDLITSECQKEESQVITDSVFNGTPITIETTRQKKSGDEFYVSILASPIFIDNKLIAAFGIYRDISERKQGESKINELNETLKEIIKILRHDILNNLMMIMQTATIIEETKDLKRMNIINYSVERSINIINKMREFESYITEERDIKRYKLHVIIEEVMKGLDTKYKIVGDSNIEVYSEFYSVIHNIVINAIKHGNTNRIDFRFRNEEKPILDIIDFGTGISNQIKSNIFKQGFSFGDNKGSGIGLSLVKRIIDRCGATIELLDNKPNGAIFRITFNNIDRF